jgi:hypothetical protein
MHLQQGDKTEFVCRFFHPDCTVGPGITPGQHLLSPAAGNKVVAGYNRRWGIAPRPETNFLPLLYRLLPQLQALFDIFSSSFTAFQISIVAAYFIFSGGGVSDGSWYDFGYGFGQFRQVLPKNIFFPACSCYTDRQPARASVGKST